MRDSTLSKATHSTGFMGEASTNTLNVSWLLTCFDSCGVMLMKIENCETVGALLNMSSSKSTQLGQKRSSCFLDFLNWDWNSFFMFIVEQIIVLKIHLIVSALGNNSYKNSWYHLVFEWTLGWNKVC